MGLEVDGDGVKDPECPLVLPSRSLFLPYCIFALICCLCHLAIAEF